MENNSNIRLAARAALKGNWGIAAIATLLYMLIMQCGSLLGVAFNITTIINAINHPELYAEYSDMSTDYSFMGFLALFLLPLAYGYTIMFLQPIRQNGYKLQIGTMFNGFKEYGRILGTMLLSYIYTMLWCLLFIIPGIIKSYSYAMTPYILKDNPKLQYNEAIEKSMAMMKGHKGKLFLLDLSIFWGFLLAMIVLELGVLFTLSQGKIFISIIFIFVLILVLVSILWLSPYLYCARAKFYTLLTEEQETQQMTYTIS